MIKSSIHDEFLDKGNKAAVDVAARAAKNRSLLKHVFDGTTSPKKRIKNAAGKTLKILGETEPKALYPRFDFFIELIDGDDTILKWIAMDVVGNLAFVDKDSKLNKKVLNRYLSLLSDDVLVTAAHSVDNLWKIAINKKRYQKEITTKLLEAEHVERNEECRRILAGKVISAFAGYFDQMSKSERGDALRYAHRHLRSPRSGTKKKAETFLKNLSAE
jgi:hypothetical protein